MQENFRSLLRVNRYICVPCSKIASEYIVRNFLWRQRLLGHFLRTFSEHAHSQTFLEPTCLTGLSSSFSNFTVSIGRARIFNVSCNENSEILIKCVITSQHEVIISSMGIDIAAELHVALRSESFNFIVLIKYKDLFIFWKYKWICRIHFILSLTQCMKHFQNNILSQAYLNSQI